MKRILYIIILISAVGSSQIRSDGAAYRFQNKYVGLGKGGGAINVILPPTIILSDIELYVSANALSRTNEADNASTGLGTVGVTLASIESSPSPQHGTSLIEITSTDQASDRMEIDLALTPGVEYVFKYYGWEASGGAGRADNWIGFDEDFIETWSTTPTEFTRTLTPTSSAQKLRFYNDAVAKAYVDGLSIKQANPTQGGGGGGGDPEIPHIVLTEKRAFPAAFGAGKYATGGPRGTYYAVTNNNDSGAGSYRDGLSQNNRTLIIKKEGLVALASNIGTNPSGSTPGRSNITIWGQFAPGRGLTISNERQYWGNPVNWIVRYMTFQNKDDDCMRAETGSGVDCHSAFTLSTPLAGGKFYYDHISARYSRDQTLDIDQRHSDNGSTMAYCLMAEGSPEHNTGGLFGDSGVGDADTGETTVARNFSYNLSHRVPTNISGDPLDAEVFNNYITNYNTRLIRTNGHVRIDYFHNYVEDGTISKATTGRANKMGRRTSDLSVSGFRTYTADNYVEGNDESPSGNQTTLWRNYKANSEGSENAPIATSHYESSRQHNFGAPMDGIWHWSDVKAKVLASVGHNRGINSDGTPGIFRDSKDQTYVNKALTDTAEGSYRPFSAFDNSSFTGEDLYTDTDGDFMPDWFEDQHAHLDKNNASDRDVEHDDWDFDDYTVDNTLSEYSNLEMCAAFYGGDFETILDGVNDLNLTL